ncbi:MAG: hypothetical protein HOV86_01035 [Thermoactinospora sp.]|nr:hypothetical protein [Thermoactinospora sp.]
MAHQQTDTAKQPPPKRRVFAKRVVGYIVAAVLLGGGGLAYNYLTGAPSTAAQGDCMSGKNEDELKVVECTDASASWVVETRVEDISEEQFNADSEGRLCTGPEATTSFWQSGRKGRGGYVLCLRPAS